MISYDMKLGWYHREYTKVKNNQRSPIALLPYRTLSLDTFVKRILFTVGAVGNISKGKS